MGVGNAGMNFGYGGNSDLGGVHFDEGGLMSEQGRLFGTYEAVPAG
jgi:hypothetical protein